jgi:asparagine synthase (glutamine-hydrolysing)
MRAMNPSPAPVDPQEETLRMRLWGDPSFFYERNFLEFDKEKQALYSADMNADFQHVNCLNHQVVNRKRLENRNVLHKRAYIDYKLRLVDHLISDHGDRMAMANSVEARYPFLDKDLVAFSTTLPSDLKLKDFTEKYILKRMASRFVPKAVTDREKFHFVAPGSPYLLQQDTGYINDILSYDTIKRQGFFDPDAVQRLKNIYSQPGFTVNAPYESDLLIIIITFGILLDKFFKL